jgi:1,4-alpha-glucan branching enzyme
VADFPGRRNWGYDGVQPFAPDSSYGRPEDLQRLVDAAHARGMAVLLDVVYNHLGPEGNYLPRYAPQFFTTRHRTPWGAAVNLDDTGCAPVRAFIVENALYWLRYFRLDGLRLDAVHALIDGSPHGILEELAERVRDEFDDRPVHLLLENEHNEARLLSRLPNGAPRDYTAQWNDDVHHVLHTAATGEGGGYYSEYLRNTRLLGRAIAEGFAFQGEVMGWRGSPRGQKSEHLPHLLAPQVPMLFMGEEWAARQPFLFFCDFHGGLADAVREGRRNEFKRTAEVADPLAEETFNACKLRWEEALSGAHAEHLRWYRRILAVRRARIVPLLAGIPRGATWQVVTDDAVWASWRCADGGRLRVSANLCGRVNEFPYDSGRVIWHEGPRPDETALGPWSVRWTLAEPRR